MTPANWGKRPWERGAYLRITSATYEAGQLVVGFGDGGVARVDADVLLRGRGRQPNWAAMTIEPLHITVPTASDEVEISWLAIRLESDPKFAAYWEATALEHHRRTGERLRDLRRSRGVGQDELARRADVPLTRLREIEDGRVALSFPTADRLLASLDYTHNDLWPREAVDPTEADAERVTA